MLYLGFDHFMDICSQSDKWSPCLFRTFSRHFSTSSQEVYSEIASFISLLWPGHISRAGFMIVFTACSLLLTFILFSLLLSLPGRRLFPFIHFMSYGIFKFTIMVQNYRWSSMFDVCQNISSAIIICYFSLSDALNKVEIPLLRSSSSLRCVLLISIIT